MPTSGQTPGPEVLRAMWTIRAFEEKVAELFAAGVLSGLLHLSIGHEGVAVGTARSLRSDDAVFSGHRPHGHALALGADPERLLGELAGRSSGYCAGRGGSMHLSAPEVGFVTATGIVAQSVPLAAGAAWSFHLDGTDGVAVVFFGDGAGQCGALHETLNIASLWELPMVFVCENNGYAEFSPLSAHTRVERIASHADTYGIPVAEVDGGDVDAVTTEVARMVNRARRGEGPGFVEARCVRLRGHYEGDSGRYRDPDEMARARDSDPIARLSGRLVDDGALSDDDVASIEKDARAAVDEMTERVLAAPPADPSTVSEGVYA